MASSNPVIKEDSLLALISEKNHDTINANYFYNIANELRRNDPKKSIEYGFKSKDLFEKHNNCQGTSKAYLVIGTAYMNTSDHISAYENYKKSIIQSIKCNDIKTIARCYNNIGILYIKQGNTSDALKNYLEALKLRRSLGDSSEVGASYANIGNVYFYEKNYKETLINYLRAIRIFEQTGNKFGLANTNSNIGNLYIIMNQPKKALPYLEVAKTINTEINDIRGLSSCFNNLGLIYLNNKQYKLAKEHFEKALVYNQTANNQEGVGENTNNLALTEFYLNNIKAAENHVTENIQNLFRIRSLYNLSEAYHIYSKIDSSRANYLNALKYYKLHIQYRDSTVNKENSDKITQQQLAYNFNKKEEAIRQEQLEKDITAKQELRLQKNITIVTLFAGALIFISLIIAVRAYNGKKAANQAISVQKALVEEKQKEILDSIHYAKRIQTTLLAHSEFINKYIPNNFILFKPKDIVSGDFYWATKKGDYFYLAVCDSTGHGVPGAFMSLLNINFLNEAINEKNIIEPNKIFEYVRTSLENSISKDGQKDGFDGILLRIDTNTGEQDYAAANNAPIIIRNGQIEQLPSDRMPVGVGERKEQFKLYGVTKEPNASLYLYTDGFADQFGGPKGKKFKYNQLNELLLSINSSDLTQQQSKLSGVFDAWKGELEQVDDVLVVGIKV